MTTATQTTYPTAPPPEAPPPERLAPVVPAGRRLVPAGLGLVGVVAVLVAAWGGIVPFVGPAFGFSADGSASWQWTASHAWLGLLPGGVAVLAALLVLAAVPRASAGAGRPELLFAGVVLVLCGAWFALGPLVWPVVRDAPAYFTAGTPFHELMGRLGYSIGPGLVLCLCGGFVVGWATRHRRPVVALHGAATGTAVPTTGLSSTAAPPTA